MKGAKTLSLKSEAALDIIDIAGWYEEKVEGLGEKFKEEFEKTCLKILQSPEAFHIINKRKHVRRFIFEKFPTKYFLLFLKLTLK